MLLICNILELTNTTIFNLNMHKSHATFAKFVDACKQFVDNLVIGKGNRLHSFIAPHFSDLEAVTLSLTAASVRIDSENCLFSKLTKHYTETPNLISRIHFNDYRKQTATQSSLIREKTNNHNIRGGKEYFCADSIPMEVCRLSRDKRCKMRKADIDKAPSFGYCDSQDVFYYAHKQHAVRVLNGAIHSFDRTKASVHDIKYLNDVKYDYHDCSIFGYLGYISDGMRQDLFETANIKSECHYRLNQKNKKTTFGPFAKARKRIETAFSQMCDQFMISRNHAKQTIELFTRIIGKISSLTIPQHFNPIINKPIGRVKYALI
jgi:Transposase DDE domain.